MFMQIPLPTVELACVAFEKEKAQRAILNTSKPLLDIMTMNIRSQPSRHSCTMCKGKGHATNKCWCVVGFHKWHFRQVL